MSWRDNLRVDPSNAELQLLSALNKDVDLKHLRFHLPIILEVQDTINEGRMWVTTPDFLDPEQHIAIYLDGPHHLKLNRSKKDDAIDQRLSEIGWGSLRIGYNGKRQSGKQLQSIKKVIHKVVVEHGYIDNDGSTRYTPRIKGGPHPHPPCIRMGEKK